MNDLPRRFKYRVGGKPAKKVSPRWWCGEVSDPAIWLRVIIYRSTTNRSATGGRRWRWGRGWEYWIEAEVERGMRVVVTCTSLEKVLESWKEVAEWAAGR